MTNVVLIDLPSIVYPIWHISASDPNPNATSTQTLDRIRGLAHGQPSTAVAIDSKRSIRRDKDPSYKATRSKEDRATLYHQMDLVIETLKREGFPVWGVDGYEADDVIASATAKALQHADVTVQIVSADKDLLALVNERVTLKSLKDGSVIDAAVVLQKFGVKPEQIPDYLCLVGDASDNIKGADKIGPVTAVKLLSTFGTLDAVYRAWSEDADQFTPAVSASLGTFLSRADDVKELIRLRADLAIPFEEIAVERKLPAFDVPAVDGFSFDADPTGLPAPKLTDADLAPERAQIEKSVEAAHAVPLLPEAPPPAPARRTRRQASTQAPTDVTPRVTVEELKALQAEAAQAEAAQANGPQKPLEPAPVEDPAPLKDRPDVMQAPTVALVPHDIEYTRQLEPRSITEAITLAKYAFESRLFGAYGTPQGALMTIMAGREMGIPTMHSLRAFDVIDGKPTLKADAIRALVLRSGKADYFRIVERTATRATFVTRRKGDPEVVLSYTIEEAQLAGYVKPGSGWTKNPHDMLVARASAKLARLVYPDVIHGLYAPEEME